MNCPHSTKVLLLRRAAATIGALVAAVLLRCWTDGMPRSLWLPAGLLVLSSVLLHRNHLGSQLLARAVLWANLLLGTLLAVTSDGSEQLLSGSLALATGVALVALGRSDAAGSTDAGPFTPVAFRRSLTAMIVLALADAQLMLLYSSLNMEKRGSASLIMVLCGFALVVAILGLYRLRVWALLLAVLVNVMVLVLAAGGAAGIRGAPALGLGITAAVQLAIAFPVLASMIRKGSAPGSEAIPVWGGVVMTIGLAGMMVLSATCAFVLQRPLIAY